MPDAEDVQCAWDTYKKVSPVLTMAAVYAGCFGVLLQILSVFMQSGPTLSEFPQRIRRNPVGVFILLAFPVVIIFETTYLSKWIPNILTVALVMAFIGYIIGTWDR